MEKRVLYGLVVMLMYLVASCVGEGEVEVIDEGQWIQILATSRLFVMLKLTSSECGYPCGVVEDQVSHLGQIFAGLFECYTADILAKPFFVKLYDIRSVPVLIIFKDGKEIFRLENPFDWSNTYDQVRTNVLSSASPPSHSALSPSDSAMPSSGSGSASTSASPSPSPVGH